MLPFFTNPKKSFASCPATAPMLPLALLLSSTPAIWPFRTCPGVPTPVFRTPSGPPTPFCGVFGGSVAETDGGIGGLLILY